MLYPVMPGIRSYLLASTRHSLLGMPYGLECG